MAHQRDSVTRLMQKPLDSTSPLWIKRQHIWKHNAFIGSAAMMRSQARIIAEASSTTVKAKELAEEIRMMAEDLEKELRAHRVDPDV